MSLTLVAKSFIKFRVYIHWRIGKLHNCINHIVNEGMYNPNALATCAFVVFTSHILSYGCAWCWRGRPCTIGPLVFQYLVRMMYITLGDVVTPRSSFISAICDAHGFGLFNGFFDFLLFSFFVVSILLVVVATCNGVDAYDTKIPTYNKTHTKIALEIRDMDTALILKLTSTLDINNNGDTV